MGFNKGQTQAIFAPSTVDVLISAGAGSGKTKVLSEHVFELIESGQIQPSELLVLTFTNNAAHEMKERIIARFGKNSLNSAKMLSSHVQTFDSFNQYLVSTYSQNLGIPASLTVASSAVMEAKKRSFLSEIYQELLKDETSRKKLLSFLTHTGTRDSQTFFDSVIQMEQSLASFVPMKKQQFLSLYEAEHFDKNVFSSWYSSLVLSYKEILKEKLYEAHFYSQNLEFLDRPIIPLTAKEASERVENFHEWNADPKTFLWADCKGKVSTLAQTYIDLLDAPNDEFFGKLDPLLEKGSRPFLIAGKKPDDMDESEYKRLKALASFLASIFGSESPLKKAQCLGNLDKEYARHLAQKEDILFLLSCALKLDERLDAYKRITNSYTFTDIGNLALTLLTDPKHEEVANALRNRFKYIMVDEYQDTNDAQEAFLDSLLTKSNEGNQAHLFVVGDAKQSIYAFRNSKVELFRQRQQSLEDGDPSHQVIAMNLNYRSGAKLLEDINHIFAPYMTLEHGGIDYSSSMEQLTYDHAVDLYHEPYDHFGLFRIVPKVLLSSVSEQRDFERKAILADILKKLESGFPVYDRGYEDPITKSHIRPCKKKDFLILTRTRSSYGAYQKLFVEAGMPLNVKFKATLTEYGPIITLQTLLKLFDSLLNATKINLPHLFASLARSYLFSYSDGALFSILSKGEESIKTDPIYLKLLGFVDAHKDEDFPTLFRSIVKEFGMIKNLPLLGEIEDNIAKLESFYSIVLGQSKMGDGLAEFVAFFSDISRFDITFDAETDIQTDDAVSLMTIHASKGLENKIVYLPVTETKMKKASKNLTSYFDEEYGFLFQDASLDDFLPLKQEKPYLKNPNTVPLLSASLKQGDPEVDEHVRLLYVALTRAENSVVLVGKEEEEDENVYAMMNAARHGYAFDPDYLKQKINAGVVGLNDARLYEDICRDPYVVVAKAFDGNFVDSVVYRLYQRLLTHASVFHQAECRYNLFASLRSSIFQDYVGKMNGLSQEELLRLYVCCNHPSLLELGPVTDFASYLSLLKQRKDEILETSLLEEGEDVKVEDPAFADLSLTETEFDQKMTSFFQSILLQNPEGLELGLNKEEKKDPALVKEAIEAAYFQGFALYFDHIASPCRLSYDDGLYVDRVQAIETPKIALKKMEKAPEVDHPLLEETAFQFEKRTKKRASKIYVEDEEDPSTSLALSRGERLHRYMELVDFIKKDTSFIANGKERSLIDKVLKMDLFASLEGFRIYKEYAFYDRDNHSTGFMDALFISPSGEYLILDYKSYSIEDPAYDEQLRYYRKNVISLFNADPSKVKMKLLSIGKAETREVSEEGLPESVQ